MYDISMPMLSATSAGTTQYLIEINRQV